MIRPLTQAIKPRGGIAILRGSLAPEGCVIKLAGHDKKRHTGPARVFEREEDAMDAANPGCSRLLDSFRAQPLKRILMLQSRAFSHRSKSPPKKAAAAKIGCPTSHFVVLDGVLVEIEPQTRTRRDLNLAVAECIEFLGF